MISSFLLSYKLKNTYKVNTIIYALKHTPLIKKIIPYSSYTSRGLKIIANIISVIGELLSFFVFKLLYLLLFYYFIVPIYSNTSLAYINIFVFLSIIGGFANTYIFNPSVDKYYAIFLLRFDAKEYTLSNYLYSLLKCLIGLMPFTIIIGLFFNTPILVCILMPLLVVNIKNIFNNISLSSYKEKNEYKNENKYNALVIICVVALLAVAYGLPYFNIGINETIFYIIFILSLILGMISLYKIITCTFYNKMCKDMIKRDELIVDKTSTDTKIYKNQISNIEIDTKDREGYSYFNYVFTKRHQRLLTKATKNISIGIVIFFIVACIICILYPGSNKNVNDLLKNSMPYYLFILYFINRGQKICQTMFINCDRSMLTYRFYREKDAILSLFRERLKTLIILNVIPGFLISIGTLILLILTGGASITLYIITFLTIIAMSIFFSVHYLVLYYLLQPYDVNMDIKNPAFMTICGVTYFICYMASQVQIPTMIFGICMCVFTIIYSVLSLYLAYKYAPTRFKLKI